MYVQCILESASDIGLSLAFHYTIHCSGCIVQHMSTVILHKYPIQLVICAFSVAIHFLKCFHIQCTCLVFCSAFFHYNLQILSVYSST